MAVGNCVWSTQEQTLFDNALIELNAAKFKTDLGKLHIYSLVKLNSSPLTIKKKSIYLSYIKISEISIYDINVVTFLVMR